MSQDARKSPSEITLETIGAQVNAAIGYSFVNPALPMEALTHRSHFNEYPDDFGHNERLEFLGDAVLDLIIAAELMRRMPLAPEGMLTLSRATLVNEETLATIGTHLNIGVLIRLGHGEEKNSGRTKASILSNAVEALAGAIYLDSDFDTVRSVVLIWFADALQEVIRGPQLFDAKSALQERLQAIHGQTPVYEVVAVTGPDHEKRYRVAIRLDETVLGEGEGRSKKDAEKSAARNALDRLRGTDA